MTNIRAAAKTIAAARRNRTPLQPFAGDAAPESEAEGYRIQDAVHGLLAEDFGALVGYKIGCTSKVMQQDLEIPHPCGGGAFAKGVFERGAALRAGDFVRVAVGCEDALKLSRMRCPTDGTVTTRRVARS